MSHTAELFLEAKERCNQLVFGDSTTLELLLIAYLAGGHVLLEGPPGTGKTSLGKLLAALLAKSFKRIQFTSDLLPADIIGSHIYSPKNQTFEFIPGPLFSDFILADEVNRTPPRTQSALLEAMEERQVTVEGKCFALSPEFFVIATQNPHDFEGTFPLPESQLDRFLLKIVVSAGSPESDAQIVQAILHGQLPPRYLEFSPLILNRELMLSEINTVQVDPSLVMFVSKIVDRTRNHPAIQVGSSVRGTISLIKAARIRALVSGRNFVIPDDIKPLILPTLRHRIRLSPEASISQTNESEIIHGIVREIGFPV